MQQFDSHKEKANVEELSDTGVEFRDLWSFDMGTKQWDTLKKSGNPPSSRSGFAMALHKRRLIVFGGVHDEDTPDGDGLISTFYDDLHAYSLDAGKWHELTISAPKRGGGSKGKASAGGGVGKAAAAAASKVEEEGDLLLAGGGRRRNHNRGGGDSDDDGAEGGKGSSGKQAAAAAEEAGADDAATSGEAGGDGSKEGAEEEGAAAAAPAPCARMKASTALRGNTLYAYGGIVEPEEASELTLNDLWTLDLNKLDGWTCLYEGEAPEKALVVEDDDEDDEDDGEEGSDDSSDSSDSEESDEAEKPKMKATIGGAAVNLS